MHRRTLALALLVAILVLGACSNTTGGGSSGDQSQIGKPAKITHVHGLGVDSSGVLYVATHFGLLKRAGDGWVYAGADQNDHMGFSLEPNARIMYRSGHSPARPSLGVESSSDGAQWTHLADVASPPVDFHAMAVSYADAKTLWGWDSGGRGTFRSTDGGKTWTPLAMNGIDRQIYALGGPDQPNVVYAGTITGLYRSHDGGNTWQHIDGLAKGWVAAIGADPTDPKHLMISTESGVKSTVDGSATWTNAGQGLPAEVTSLAISAADPKTAYAADSTSVYQTTDGGKSWTAMGG